MGGRLRHGPKHRPCSQREANSLSRISREPSASEPEHLWIVIGWLLLDDFDTETFEIHVKLKVALKYLLMQPRVLFALHGYCVVIFKAAQSVLPRAGVLCVFLGEEIK